MSEHKIYRGIGCHVVLIVAKEALLLSLTLSFVLYDFFFKDIYSILLHFMFALLVFFVEISGNYNQ